MQIVFPVLEHQCPFCKNPFFGSEVASYSIYGSNRYSDGTTVGTYGIPMHSATWLTRCPACGKFFEKKHIQDRDIPPEDIDGLVIFSAFGQPFSEEDKKYIRDYLLSSDRRGMERAADKRQGQLIFRAKRSLREYRKAKYDEDMRKENRAYGRLHGTGAVYDSDPGIEGIFCARFWRDALVAGLSFPVEPTEEERALLHKRLLLHLWQAYHRPTYVYSKEKLNLDDVARQAQCETWYGVDSLEECATGLFYLPQIDLEGYFAFCKEILPYFQAEKEDDLLVLAELYRNLGEFGLCIRTLEKVKEGTRHADLIEGIFIAAKQGITKTIEIHPAKNKKRSGIA